MHFRWEPRLRTFVKQIEDSREIQCHNSTRARDLAITHQFRELLDDAGLPGGDEGTSPLHLSDLYVEPELRRVDMLSGSMSKRIGAAELLAILEEKRRIALLARIIHEPVSTRGLSAG